MVAPPDTFRVSFHAAPSLIFIKIQNLPEFLKGSSLKFKPSVSDRCALFVKETTGKDYVVVVVPDHPSVNLEILLCVFPEIHHSLPYLSGSELVRTTDQMNITAFAFSAPYR